MRPGEPKLPPRRRAAGPLWINGTARASRKDSWQTDSLTQGDLLALLYSVPAEHRNREVWLMNSATLLALHSNEDADGRLILPDPHIRR
jgi:HK97 family phage major capsid protein